MSIEQTARRGAKRMAQIRELRTAQAYVLEQRAGLDD